MFSYTGQQYIPEIDLYHYKARYYNADIGRFLQINPIGYEADLNLYAYAFNDPVNLTDPTGEQGQNAELISQGVFLLTQDFTFKRQLNRAGANVQRRTEIAQRFAARADAFGLPGDSFLDSEFKTRPSRLRDPNSLKPTQDGFSEFMTDANGTKRGGSIRQLADDLSNGLDPADVDPVRIFRDENGDFRTLDHRRVQAAIRAGTQVNTFELTLDEARALPRVAGQRARSGRPETIRPNSSRPRIRRF